MFIQRIYKKTAKKTYSSVLLMESYREGKKVKHRTISNLSKWPDALVTNFEKVLKGEKTTNLTDLNLKQGKSMGGILAVSQVAKELGISQALGYTKQAKLAMVQIAGRVLSQGSRNYLANEWQLSQATDTVFNLDEFTKYDLYDNLDWLCNNQDKIEKKIFTFRNKKQAIKEVFLYDVTSSYFEGSKNELAQYGYNRDKKKGKTQIVIGLLTDDKGYPISVEVFKGSTGDTKTVSNQLRKLKENFGVERVVFVGDKGMVKSSQIAELTSEQYKWNYLTTITKQQIKTLISKDILQLDLFAEKITEVQVENGVRYILRRNPVRADELKSNRQAKINKVKEFIKEKNLYLSEHKKAKIEVALRKISELISKLKLKKIIQYTSQDRVIEFTIEIGEQSKAEELDGCYVVKTNVPKDKLETKVAHDRYKDLAHVEFAFRTMKTTIEDIRPIYLRKADRTRGHVFVAMLAYMIIKNITDKLVELDYSRKFILESLDKINYLEYTYEDCTLKIIPQNLLEHQEKIIQKLNLKLK